MAELTSQELISLSAKNINGTTKPLPVEQKSKVIDGGYGWIITAVSFYNLFLGGGTVMCYGVIYVEFLDYFQESRTKTSLIGGLTLLSIAFSGPASSILSNTLSHRTVALAGGVIAAASIATSAFADSIYFLFVSFGLMGGGGMGLSMIPSIALVALYFDKRRSTAVAIALSGGGIAYLVFPPVMDICIKHLSWRGTMLVLASMWIQSCVGCALMRPLVYDEDNKKSSNAATKCEQGENHVEVSSSSKNTPSVCDAVLLKNWHLWVYLICEYLWHIDFMNFAMLLPDFSVLNGYGKSSSGLLLTILGGVLIPARIVGGYLVDRTGANPLFVLAMLIISNGAISVVFPFSGASYHILAVLSGLRGAVHGALAIMAPSVLVLLFTTERMTSALGYDVVAMGMGQLTAPPLGGVLYDLANDYLPVYLTCAGCSFAAALAAIVLFIATRKKITRLTDLEMESPNHGEEEEALNEESRQPGI